MKRAFDIIQGTITMISDADINDHRDGMIKARIRADKPAPNTEGASLSGILTVWMPPAAAKGLTLGCKVRIFGEVELNG